MGSDLDQLRSLYVDVARISFNEFRNESPKEDFYAFGLYSDDGAMTVVPVANTESSFDRHIRSCIQKAGSASAERRFYYRYTPDEWAYRGVPTVASLELQKASNLHDQLLNGIHEDEFPEFKRLLFAMMTGVLKELDQSSFFGTGNTRQKITLLSWVSNSHDAEDLRRDSVEFLNPTGVCEQFFAADDAAMDDESA